MILKQGLIVEWTSNICMYKYIICLNKKSKLIRGF